MKLAYKYIIMHIHVRTYFVYQATIDTRRSYHGYHIVKEENICMYVNVFLL